MKISLVCMLLMSNFALAKNDSVYTDINGDPSKSVSGCKTLYDSEKDPNAELSGFDITCKGRDKFKVNIVGGDARSHIDFVKGDRVLNTAQNPKDPLELFWEFGIVKGTKLEWRYNDAKQLVGVIFRMEIVKRNDTNKPTYKEILYVFRMDDREFCQAGRTQHNQEARDILDAVSAKSCADINPVLH